MTQRYPLQWPPGRPRAKWPRDGRFSADGRPITIARAMDRLEAELTRIGAKDALLSSNLALRLDGRPRSDQGRPTDEGVCAYFTLKGKPYALACDAYRGVAQNIGALAAHLEATRAIERHGVATAAEMFTAFVALPPPKRWWEVLGLESTATWPEVSAAFRRLAAKNHPDQGGSTAAMAALNRARDDARKELGAHD